MYVLNFKELYFLESKNESIDFDSGVHTVFSFCFVPVLKEAILNDDAIAQKMFDYLEKWKSVKTILLVKLPDLLY